MMPSANATPPLSLQAPLTNGHVYHADVIPRHGRSLGEIANQFGITLEQARDEVRKFLEDARLTRADDKELIRQMELDRLDALTRAILPKALTGDLKAIDRMLKIMERRAKLLGLDAKDRKEKNGNVTVYLRESQNEEL